MIRLLNINKKYGNSQIITNLSYDFPDKGLYSICGPSGCGKTTLLNIIGLITNFEGKLSFDGVFCNLSNKKQVDYIRNTKIGFVFQDYKLFDFENIEANIKLSMDIKTSESEKIKKQRINDLLKTLDIKKDVKTIVNTLSGGEKQRVAIARALSNNPKIILADEPTGNLDVANSEAIMELLAKISKNVLVIMVTHDQELAKKYSDRILYLKDGRIIKEQNIENKNILSRLSLLKITNANKRADLPISFCLKHSYNITKKRKWRTLLSILTTSLGLIGVGLGSVISDVISKNLSSAYTSIIDSSKVVLKSKENIDNHQIITSLNGKNVSVLKDKYKEDIAYDGIYYQNNFLEFFTYYSFSINGLSSSKIIPTLNPQHFNDYINILDNKNDVYFWDKNELEKDEIILSTTPGLLNEICYQLFIPRTAESFKEYLESHNFIIDVYLENCNWQYYKEFSLKVSGFTLSNIDGFIHTSNSWNEYIFEEICKFDTTNIINRNTSHPWDLKKLQYFSFKSKRDEFLHEIKANYDYLYVVSEILTKEYYPYLLEKIDIEDCNRVGLYSIENKDQIPLYLSSYFKSVNKNVLNAVPGCVNSYAMYPKNFMMGFAKQTYISSDTNYLDNIIDLTSYIKSSEDKILNYPSNILLGYFAKNDGLKFSPNFTLIEGRKPLNYNEIVVSTAVITSLGISNPINKSIYLCFPKEEQQLSNGYIKRNYVTTEMKIVGISNSNKLELNHNENWPILFFQIKLGISSFSLFIDSFSLDVNDGYKNDVIKDINIAFPYLEATNPISTVEESINEVCNAINLVFTILSICSLIISSILLSVSNYLYFLEIKKDVGLVQCLGASKKESKKLIYSHSFLMSLISLFISCLEYVLISLLLNKGLQEYFSLSSSFYISLVPFLYMFLLAFGIGLISSLFASIKLNKYSTLECFE